MKTIWEPTDVAGARAAALVRRLAQTVPSPSPAARARVWARLEQRRGSAWRLAWPMFLAGAATAAVVLLLWLPRGERALVIDAAGAQRTVREGQYLPPLPARSLVELYGAARGVAGPGTVARLTRFSARAVEIDLERGSLLLHVLPRGERAPLLVRTPDATTRVVGTVLRVSVDGAGRSTIAVGHGLVEVTPRGGAPVPVPAGQRWGGAEAPDGDELALLGGADLEGATVASFVIPAVAVSPAEDPIRAESLLYQTGWSRMHSHGDVRGALALWQRQRSRFPDGVLHLEAQASIIDALVALGEYARARAEVDAYLRAAPGGLRAPEMHFVRGTLLRQADGDCRRARVELDRALQHPSEPWASRARAARAACPR